MTKAMKMISAMSFAFVMSALLSGTAFATNAFTAADLTTATTNQASFISFWVPVILGFIVVMGLLGLGMRKISRASKGH